MKKYLAQKTPFRKRLVAEGFHNENLEITEQLVCDFYHELSKTLGMTIVHGPCVGYWAEDFKPDVYTGNEAYVIWAESGSQFYWWRTKKFFTVDIYTCNDFDVEQAVSIVRKYFGNEFQYNLVPQIYESIPQLFQFDRNEKGRTVCLTEDVKMNTFLCSIKGNLYYSESEKRLLEFGDFVKDSAIPIAQNYYVDQTAFGNGDGILRSLNHSCNPNAKIVNSLELWSHRDIKKGEEITISYSTICDSDWENPEGVCLCGSQKCNGRILPWRELPREQQKYFLENNLVSDWIIMKYLKKEKVDFAKLMGL